MPGKLQLAAAARQVDRSILKGVARQPHFVAQRGIDFFPFELLLFLRRLSQWIFSVRGICFFEVRGLSENVFDVSCIQRTFRRILSLFLLERIGVGYDGNGNPKSVFTEQG
ncbi:hypothetical protein KKK_25615 [Pseudomonas putida B6-2]|nr:hypothetical protein KKK_25615 [Pseudomonas putida B6-2]